MIFVQGRLGRIIPDGVRAPQSADAEIVSMLRPGKRFANATLRARLILTE
jgi:hypothetical protein